MHTGSSGDVNLVENVWYTCSKVSLAYLPILLCKLNMALTLRDFRKCVVYVLESQLTHNFVM